MSRNRKLKSRSASSAAQVSAARAEANRANAQKSTGPRTAAGKARSSRNAYKHGLYSHAIIQLAKDDGTQNRNSGVLERLVDEFHEAFAPRDAVEAVLVDHLAAQHFRLCRLTMEREVFAFDQYKTGGVTHLDVESRCVPFGIGEERIERSLSRTLRDLVFLQRWRTDPGERRRGSAAPAPSDPRPQVSLTPRQVLPPAPETLEADPWAPEPIVAAPVMATAEFAQAGTSEAEQLPDAVETVAPEVSHPSAEPAATATESSEPSAPEAAPAESRAPAAAAGPSKRDIPISERVTPHGIHRTYLRDGLTFVTTTPFDWE